MFSHLSNGLWKFNLVIAKIRQGSGNLAKRRFIRPSLCVVLAAWLAAHSLLVNFCLPLKDAEQQKVRDEEKEEEEVGWGCKGAFCH